MQDKTKNRLKGLLLGTVMSLPLFGCVSCSVGHFMDMSLSGPAVSAKMTPEKASAIVATTDGYVSLDNVPQSQILSQTERMKKLAKLKQNVQGFTATETQKIHRALNVLFALPDAYIQSRLNDIPTDVLIRPNLKYEGQIDTKTASAFYNSGTKSVVLFPENLKSSDLEVMCMVAHELDHADKNKKGLGTQISNMIDNERFVSFMFLDEADACSYEEHLKMCGAEYLAKSGRLDAQEREILKKDASHNSYREKYATAIQKLQKPIGDMQVTMQAQGQYVKALLHGDSPKFNLTYQGDAIEALGMVYGGGDTLSTSANKELTRYVYATYAQKHGLSLKDLEQPVKWYLNAYKGQLAEKFEPLEKDTHTLDSIDQMNKEFKQTDRQIQSNLKKQLSQRQSGVRPNGARGSGGR